MSEYRSNIKPLYGTPRSKTHWANAGLCGAWDMNEGSGLIAHDSSGNGNDGVLTGMSPMSPVSGWVPGPHGGALAFPGTDAANAYVSIPLTPIGTKTIIAWIIPKVNGLNERRAILGNYLFDFGASSAPILRHYNTATLQTLSSISGIPDNSLSTCALVFNKEDDTLTFYINGRYDVVRATPNFNQQTTYLGTYLSPGHWEYAGLISSVSIYNVARQPDEIAYLNTFPWCGYEDEKGMQEWLFNQNATAMQQLYRFYSIGAGR